MGQEKITPIIKEFILESNENITLVSDRLTKLEKHPDDHDMINEVYRAVHTIKGGAGFLKFKNLESITHNFENLLDLIRSAKIAIQAQIVDICLEATDVIVAHLQNVELTGTELDEKNEDLKVRLISIIEKDQTKEEALIADTHVDTKVDSKIKIKVAPQQKSEAPVSKPVQESKASEIAKPAKVKEAPVKAVVKDKDTPTKTAPAPAKSGDSLADSVVRVNVNLLDKIMNVVGELVLTRNQIVQYAASNENDDLIRLTHQLNNITSELQGDVMTTRMQPIGSVLNRFERIVRDMARDLGKKIDLKIEGKGTELDKTLLEAIKDPLTHMIRNSVDHGIEMPDIRTSNGKSETGTLSINAYHEGGQVTIEIKDDGGGIPKAVILGKAVEKGLVSEDDAKKMSDKEILALIFNPGFSTAEKVTNISGRGVGMDVVRTNIEKIGGKIDLASEEGEGSTFKLKIPLTLAIIPALIVEDFNEKFAIPQINLLELVRIDDESKEQIEVVNGSEFFRLRGDLIPIIRLQNVLKRNSEQNSIDAESIAILNSDGRVYGLAVKDILDTVEIVVKPLSSQLKSQSIFAGATIMGDGNVSLILDVNGIANKVHLSADRQVEEEEVIQRFDMQDILLFNIGREGLYGVPLPLVNRLEEFKSKNVEFTGEQAVV
ncbi:MAG: chemotaxis protein CheA, partial [Bdellovibrionales bacterium]